MNRRSFFDERFLPRQRLRSRHECCTRKKYELRDRIIAALVHKVLSISVTERRDEIYVNLVETLHEISMVRV